MALMGSQVFIKYFGIPDKPVSMFITFYVPEISNALTTYFFENKTIHIPMYLDIFGSTEFVMRKHTYRFLNFFIGSDKAHKIPASTLFQGLYIY